MGRNPSALTYCYCQSKLFPLTPFAFDKEFREKKKEKLLMVTKSRATRGSGTDTLPAPWAPGTSSGNTEELAWFPLQHAGEVGRAWALQLQPPTLGSAAGGAEGAHSEGGASQASSWPFSHRDPNTGDSRNGREFTLTEWRVCKAVGNPQSEVGCRASPKPVSTPHLLS